MRLKIISDGTPEGTRITNAATGEVLENARAVSWRCEADGPAIAEITIWMAEGEFEAVPQFRPQWVELPR